MASSRWKRFAFFDRHTLNVPNEVLEDVIPRSGVSNITTSSSNTTNTNRGSTTGGGINHDDDKVVSLVVTTAGLPLTTRLTSTSTTNTTTTTTAATTTTATTKSSTTPGQSSSGGTAESDSNNDTAIVSAMWSSLLTCSVTTNYESAALAEETSISFPTRGSSSSSGPDAAAATNTKSNANSTTAAQQQQQQQQATLDGLVLAFLSSPETEFVHCIDVTVRCNPPVPNSNSSNTTSTAVATTTNEQPSQQQQQSQQQRGDLEDMDGWRGYLCPFAATATAVAATTSVANTTSTTNNTGEDFIRDLAVCRLTTHHHNRHSPIHLACLSKHKIVIWEDPHLHLSCRRPLQLSSAHTTPETKLWQFSPPHPSPTGASTTSSGTSSNTTGYNSNSTTHTTVDGDFCCVSMIPGVVAMGTTKGAVLIYSYNPHETQPPSSVSSSLPLRSGATTTTNNKKFILRRYLRIPPPLVEYVQVTSVKVCQPKQHQDHNKQLCVFVVYHRQPATATTNTAAEGGGGGASGTTAGICCYDMPLPSTASSTYPHTQQQQQQSIAAPSARHDLDGRHVTSRRLVDAAYLGDHHHNARLVVARPDGLYTYSQTERTSVSPIDGHKLTVAIVPHAASLATAPGNSFDNAAAHNNNHSTNRRPLDTLDHEVTATLGYALLASTDDKSGRDAVDVYDSTNKLVAFHLLLSPGHSAVRAAGVATPSTICSDGSTKGGRSSALVFTSGGSLVTLTEKRTAEKVDLLVKKNLYSAAVVVAYSDPAFPASEISLLYRRYAEHLYRKGDLSGAMDQYIHTIGSLESSHVIFRFLDAPKIPLLVKYLQHLRERGRATPVHDELLRTCYLKLNDAEAAEAISSSSTSTTTINRGSFSSVLSNLTTANPKEALSTICALEAPEAVDILVIHGASLARVLPQETAGVVVALCVGSFSPQSLAQSSKGKAKDLKEMVELQTTTSTATNTQDSTRAHEPYPVELFASAFIEQPKMLRLILSHCNRNKCPLTPALRRTLLELTLHEWNQAKRTGDTEALKLRHKDAIAALTDSHSREIGDYDALVICQLAGFEEGQLLLYERLQMTPMLLERYAKDGSEKARRQMLAMCQSDPDILPDVLGYFVAMASERLAAATADSSKMQQQQYDDDSSYAEETEELLDDIQATLALARRQGASPPVRIARILAGEGTGQFSSFKPTTTTSTADHHHKSTASSASSSASASSEPPKHHATVPLSVALDYVGTILEESRHEGARLKAEVEEYNELCNSMEREIESLLRTSRGLPPLSEQEEKLSRRVLNIDEWYTKIRHDDSNAKSTTTTTAADPSITREAFWREMNQSEAGGDSLETIARFFAKGVIR